MSIQFADGEVLTAYENPHSELGMGYDVFQTDQGWMLGLTSGSVNLDGLGSVFSEVGDYGPFGSREEAVAYVDDALIDWFQGWGEQATKVSVKKTAEFPDFLEDEPSDGAEDNPFPPEDDSADPDALGDGTVDGEELPTEEVTPMTTRPHHLPGGANDKLPPGAEEDDSDSEAPAEEPNPFEATLIPIRCMKCSRKFDVSKVSLGMKCICGSEEIDLDMLRVGLDVALPSAEIPQGGGMDLPMAEVNEFQPQLGKLPENDTFAEPFTDDNPVEEKVEAMVAYIQQANPDVSRLLARKFALKTIAKYPIIANFPTVTVEPRPATEPGALDGFAITCSECGYVGGSSLPTQADSLKWQHLNYMHVGKQ